MPKFFSGKLISVYKKNEIIFQYISDIQPYKVK